MLNFLPQLKKELRPRITFADMDTSYKDVTVVDCDWKHITVLMQSFTDNELYEVRNTGDIVTQIAF